MRASTGMRASSLLAAIVSSTGLLLAAPGHAVDGVREINHDAIQAGGGYPWLIDEPGSYRLTGNLDVSGESSPLDRTAIVITADNVWLDLNGFSLIGPQSCNGSPAASSGAGDGVQSSGVGTVVVDGFVEGFGRDGLSLGNRARVERVNVSCTGGTGIAVGDQSSVDGSSVEDSVEGMAAGAGSLVRDNRMTGNLGFGLVVGEDAAYGGNVLRGNNGGGAALQVAAGDGAFELDTNVCESGTSCTVGPLCGNGLAEDSEQCDGADLAGQTCDDFGFTGGTLACNGMSCTVDTSACGPIPGCGNGMIDGMEQCDGMDLGGESCASRGFVGGSLSCNPQTCTFDTSNCTGMPVCGNGVQEGLEECDGMGVDTPTCDADCTLVVCGDGTSNAAAGEGCDDGNANNLDDCPDGIGGSCQPASCGDGFCNAFGMASEDAMSCPADCASTCGNGNVEGLEECDGMDLAGQTCVGLGFVGGTLQCDNMSCLFETSLCTNCGNGTIDMGEQCDGANLGGQSCSDLGFFAGTLACNSMTCQFVTSGCTDCGNGTIDMGEQCDGMDLAGQDCVGLGFVGGTLQCNPTTCQYLTSLCSNCGNGTIDMGEQCDGADLGGQTCSDQGFVSGTLACDGSCGFDTSGCSGMPVCGDGNVEGLEECDDSGESASCDDDCSFVVCGDGNQNGTAGEGCDDGDENTNDSCPDGGGASCQPASCGDGFVWNQDGGMENCDDGNQDNSDTCPDGVGGTCQPAFCGDGFCLLSGMSPEDSMSCPADCP